MAAAHIASLEVMPTRDRVEYGADAAVAMEAGEAHSEQYPIVIS